MLDALKEAAARIGELIAGDEFPGSIRPEFLRDAVRDYPSRGGKRLRPALVLWSCGLFGGDPERARFAAAAVEVVHNWTLVHDDIIDQDRFRRNEPTAHCKLEALMREVYSRDEAEAVRCGRDFAILCGDMQQAWANDLLLRSEVPPAVLAAMARQLQRRGNFEVISGEALDMELALRPIESIRPAEVIEMLELKTGALLRLSVELGAMAALESADPERPEIRAISDFALDCGVAFQLRDDYLGIFGDEAKLGKAVGGDLREAKPTVLLLTALERSGEKARRELLGFLRRERYSAADLEQVRTLMTGCGAAAELEADWTRRIAAARARLGAFPGNRFRQYLLELADYLVGRQL